MALVILGQTHKLITICDLSVGRTLSAGVANRPNHEFDLHHTWICAYEPVNHILYDQGMPISVGIATLAVEGQTDTGTDCMHCTSV
jgi:hypothetical protein